MATGHGLYYKPKSVRCGQSVTVPSQTGLKKYTPTPFSTVRMRGEAQPDAGTRVRGRDKKAPKGER
jgi:hypothetical protein